MVSLVQYFDGSNVDVRFSSMFLEFKEFCKAIGEQTYLQKFSPDTVGCGQSMLDVPDGHWNRGTVTTNLMRFIESWCDKNNILGSEDENFQLIVAVLA
ncbi:unnamed protein product [Symbiodinium sp. CCMP2592]|nr:unnamed protein product [Symbiodinium sp. CCMP2592]